MTHPIIDETVLDSISALLSADSAVYDINSSCENLFKKIDSSPIIKIPVENKNYLYESHMDLDGDDIPIVLSYTIKRIIRGFSSINPGTRERCSVILNQILNKYPRVYDSASWVLKLLSKTQTGLSRGEEKALVCGRILALRTSLHHSVEKSTFIDIIREAISIWASDDHTLDSQILLTHIAAILQKPDLVSFPANSSTLLEKDLNTNSLQKSRIELQKTMLELLSNATNQKKKKIETTKLAGLLYSIGAFIPINQLPKVTFEPLLNGNIFESNSMKKISMYGDQSRLDNPLNLCLWSGIIIYLGLASECTGGEIASICESLHSFNPKFPVLNTNEQLLYHIIDMATAAHINISLPLMATMLRAVFSINGSEKILLTLIKFDSFITLLTKNHICANTIIDLLYQKLNKNHLTTSTKTHILARILSNSAGAKIVADLLIKINDDSILFGMLNLQNIYDALTAADMLSILVKYYSTPSMNQIVDVNAGNNFKKKRAILSEEKIIKIFCITEAMINLLFAHELDDRVSLRLQGAMLRALTAIPKTGPSSLLNATKEKSNNSKDLIEFAVHIIDIKHLNSMTEGGKSKLDKLDTPVLDAWKIGLDVSKKIDKHVAKLNQQDLKNINMINLGIALKKTVACARLLLVLDSMASVSVFEDLKTSFKLWKKGETTFFPIVIEILLMWLSRPQAFLRRLADDCFESLAPFILTGCPYGEIPNALESISRVIETPVDSQNNEDLLSDSGSVSFDDSDSSDLILNDESVVVHSSINQMTDDYVKNDDQTELSIMAIEEHPGKKIKIQSDELELDEVEEQDLARLDEQLASVFSARKKHLSSKSDMIRTLLIFKNRLLDWILILSKILNEKKDELPAFILRACLARSLLEAIRLHSQGGAEKITEGDLVRKLVTLIKTIYNRAPKLTFKDLNQLQSIIILNHENMRDCENDSHQCTRSIAESKLKKADQRLIKLEENFKKISIIDLIDDFRQKLVEKVITASKSGLKSVVQSGTCIFWNLTPIGDLKNDDLVEKIRPFWLDIFKKDCRSRTISFFTFFDPLRSKNPDTLVALTGETHFLHLLTQAKPFVRHQMMRFIEPALKKCKLDVCLPYFKGVREFYLQSGQTRALVDYSSAQIKEYLSIFHVLVSISTKFQNSSDLHSFWTLTFETVEKMLTEINETEKINCKLTHSVQQIDSYLKRLKCTRDLLTLRS